MNIKIYIATTVIYRLETSVYFYCIMKAITITTIYHPETSNSSEYDKSYFYLKYVFLDILIQMIEIIISVNVIA